MLAEPAEEHYAESGCGCANFRLCGKAGRIKAEPFLMSHVVVLKDKTGSEII